MIIGVLAAGAAISFFIYRLAGLTASPPGIPRVGAPGLIGYIRTALAFTVNAENLLSEGCTKFSGRPFAVPTLAGLLIILGPELIEQLRASNDTIVRILRFCYIPPWLMCAICSLCTSSTVQPADCGERGQWSASKPLNLSHFLDYCRVCN